LAELVDARDLKSLGPKGRAGSTPAAGTNRWQSEFSREQHWRRDPGQDQAGGCDAAEYLASEGVSAEYLAAAFETGDSAFIGDAIGIVARVKGMTEADGNRDLDAGARIER
jgi:hypothetical protein